MNNFEVKKLDNGKYYINTMSSTGDLTLSQGVVVTKSELKSLYIKLLQIFTEDNN